MNKETSSYHGKKRARISGKSRMVLALNNYIIHKDDIIVDFKKYQDGEIGRFRDITAKYKTSPQFLKEALRIWDVIPTEGGDERDNAIKEILEHPEYAIRKYKGNEYLISCLRFSLLLKGTLSLDDVYGGATVAIYETAKGEGEVITQPNELFQQGIEGHKQGKPATARGRTIEMLNERKGNAGLLAEARESLQELNVEIEKIHTEVVVLKVKEKGLATQMAEDTGLSLRSLIGLKRESARKLDDIRAEIAIAQSPLPALKIREARLQERVMKYRILVAKDNRAETYQMIQDVKYLFGNIRVAIDEKLGQIEERLKDPDSIVDQPV